ncbi:MAG: NAD(P)-binding protein, partial [Phycisphaerales bacterium]|nr:NAD(P)-binding protein [Phycisphaerales bacterium]
MPTTPSLSATSDRQPPSDQQAKVVIIGAGPTGLGAAYRLKELGYTNFKVFDRHPYIGG